MTYQQAADRAALLAELRYLTAQSKTVQCRLAVLDCQHYDAPLMQLRIAQNAMDAAEEESKRAKVGWIGAIRLRSQGEPTTYGDDEPWCQACYESPDGPA